MPTRTCTNATCQNANKCEIPSKRHDDDDTNGNVQMKNHDVNDMLISAVSETLKKLEEIRKDLSMFKDIKAIKETKSKLKKYLLKLNHLLVSNLLSQRELDVINAYANNNNTNKQEVCNDEGKKKNERAPNKG